jgi:hypothetical protein
MKKITILTCGMIVLLTIFLSGCINQKDNVDTQLGEGTLQLKITDKPGELDIIYANVTMSMVQVHKSGAETNEEENEDTEEYNNTDEYNDGFIANAYGPYFGEIAEDIVFMGNATGGVKPYNWSWDFGDGAISYEQNATHNYSTNGTYTVNLTVTDNNGSGVIDLYISFATIGTVDEEDTSIAGWYTIVNESQTFDLIALQNVTEVLGENNLTEGKYTQIRLTVVQAEITINNSGTIEIHNLIIPSKNVKLIKPFWIYENETTVLTLDFDVYKSIHQTGNNKFIMKPTIKVIQG